MSFIDLHSSNIFTQHEIDSRVVDIIRQQFSADDEFKLNRILQGAALNRYTISPEEQAEVDAFETCVLAAVEEGRQATADNALLQATLEYEQAEARLANPALDPLAVDEAGELLYPDVDDGTGTTLDNPALTGDVTEREAAQAIVDAASAEVLALVAERNV